MNSKMKVLASNRVSSVSFWIYSYLNLKNLLTFVSFGKNITWKIFCSKRFLQRSTENQLCFRVFATKSLSFVAKFLLLNALHPWCPFFSVSLALFFLNLEVSRFLPICMKLGRGTVEFMIDRLSKVQISEEKLAKRFWRFENSYQGGRI